MLGFFAQAVLANEHKGCQENRFQGHDHGQEPVWKWVERTHAYTSGVKKNPHGKPRNMHIDKGHVPRKSSDGVGDTVLHASRTSSLQAKLDNGANVPLNDLAQCRVVFCVVSWCILVQAALLHKTDVLPFCFRVARCNLS